MGGSSMRDKTRKILYMIFRYRLAYMLYLLLIPITIFMQRSVKNKSMIHSLLEKFS